MNMKTASTLSQGLTSLASGEPLDDKELMLENGVAMLQGLPLNSGLSAATSNAFIKMLWHDLPHPATTVAGPTARYRRHDGGNNNPWNPEMGKAGTPYARTVPPLRPKGPNLPDPELVFEQLLKRPDNEFREHPSGLNRLFFSFATIVIHECFQTRRGTDQWINETSSYVDLSTLYGNTEVEQGGVRTYNNGLIYKDSYASERIAMMPPGVVALLVMFSRNHNVIAKDLLSINEEGRYGEWDKLKTEGNEPGSQKWQDEDIFQIARNINVGFFATVVLKDYVAAILNTPRANSTWSLDLGGEIKAGGNRVERGTGNVVSVEFAVLYHWHAALSAADGKWMEDIIRKNIPELGDLTELNEKHFMKVMMAEGHQLKNTPPPKWTFGGIERNPDGSFNDADLAKILLDCVEEPAHAFGAHGTPASLKIVDVMGQLQARNCFNVCTMNEFRRYLNLKPYASFKDWNPDPKTARSAELLYGHIDNLELYPGLMAECTKPAMPGSGVCPGQTTGRGILNDAVALVRGDRYLSYDLNSSTLTNWGLGKIGVVAPGSYGGMLPKILFTGLPHSFTGTSAYALLPFYTPKAAKKILEGNGVVQQYDLKRPAGNPMVAVHTQEACKKILEDRATFRTMYQPAVTNCTDGHEFMLGWDEQKKHDARSNALHKIFFEEGFEKNVGNFFRANVAALIKNNSLTYSGSRRSIDIVRDVTNVTPILWLAERFAIPLKSDEHGTGLISRPQLLDMWLVLFFYQSVNFVPRNEWELREGAMKAAPILREILMAHLKTQQGMKEHIVDWLAKGSAYEVSPDADRIYKALLRTNLPLSDLVSDSIRISAPIAGNLTQQASLLIELFLRPQYATYKTRLIHLAHQPDDDDASNRELQGFVFEAMRHAAVVPGVLRVATRDTLIDDDGELRGGLQQQQQQQIREGQIVFVALSKAAMDPVAFPEPEKLDPFRPLSSYILLGHGLHFCFGARLVAPALVATLKEIFKLKNLRRATGRCGLLHGVEHEISGTGGVMMKSYLDHASKESPIPTTLTLEYDA